jgi:NTE family protein
MKKKNRSVALVLSSGGSKGLAHIGVINELEKQGFEITSIAGSSIGSLIGGLHAMDKLTEYTNWVKTLDKRAIWGLLDFTISKNGLLKGEKVFDKMKTFIPDISIEEMKIPFSAIAADILNEQEIVFTTGSFYNAIRASISIPDIFTPVKYKDTILVDGGVLAPVPIEFVKRNDNDILVVVNLYGDDVRVKKPKLSEKENDLTGRLKEIIRIMSKLINTGDKKRMGFLTLFDITTKAMIHKIAKQNIAYHQPDILINIPKHSANTFDFYKADQLIEIGQVAANKAISEYIK